METTFRDGADARDGGVDITIHMSAEENAAIGADAALMVDRLSTALAGLVALREKRDGKAMVDLAYWVINDLDVRLLPSLEAIRDAVIRAHKAAGGSVGHLGLAMDAPRSTAQYRRDVVLASQPSRHELWATGDLPGQRPDSK